MICGAIDQVFRFGSDKKKSDKWKADIFPNLDKSQHPFDEKTYGNNYWYAWVNAKEYFAVTTEGFNQWAHPLNKWPLTRFNFEKEDPTGFAAVKAMWSLSASKIDEGMGGCTYQNSIGQIPREEAIGKESNSNSIHTVMIGVVIAFVIVLFSNAW